MKRFSMAALCVALLVPAVPAAAQGLNFGPQLGYYKARDADNGEVMYGAALRLRILPFLGAEGSINYRQEDYGDNAVTVRSWPVMITGLLYPIPFLYGALGAGWYNTTFDYNNDLADLGSETKQEFGWHVGGGLELPLGTVAKVTGDIRYVFLDYNFADAPQLPETDADFYVITIGVLFGG